MKKLSLVPLALIVIVGVVWASSIITPDKPGFPSLPDTPGTIGYSLTHFFTPIGDALDTEKLNGVSASGYLKSTDSLCTNPGYVWKSIKPDGTAECQAKAASLLAIGIFSELSPGVEVSKNNGSTWSPANTTDILYNGDLIRTNSTGTGTIDFVADDSLLRLGTDTLVQLEIGRLDGNTVAQAIVNNGSLWGRVLTSTGINIGGGGVVAGVRGTSVRVIASSPTLADIAIIDTANPQPATLTNRAGQNTQLPPGKKITTNTSSGFSIPLNIDLATDLTDTTRAENRFTQANLKLDLDYLLTLSGSSIKTPQTRIDAEIASLSMSGTSTDQKFGEMACSEYGTGLILWRPLLSERTTRKDACIYAIADYTIPAGAGRVNTAMYRGNIQIPLATETVIPYIVDDGNFMNSYNDRDPDFPTSIRGVWNKNDAGWCETGHQYCNSFKNSYEFGSYDSFYLTRAGRITYTQEISKSWNKSYYTGLYGRNNIILSSTSNGINISGSNYISYPLAQLQDEIGNLAGKTIEIEFDSLPTTGIIFDGGNIFRVSRNAGYWICRNNSNIASDCSNPSTGYPFKVIQISSNKIQITNNSVTPERFIFGNSQATGFGQPIGVKIKYIKITN